MATSATVPAVPIGIAPAATGSGGVAGSSPVTPRNHAKASATAIGAAAATIHHTHGPTGLVAAAHAREAVDGDQHRRQQQGGDEQPHGPQGQHLAQRDERRGRAAEPRGSACCRAR